MLIFHRLCIVVLTGLPLKWPCPDDYPIGFGLHRYALSQPQRRRSYIIDVGVCWSWWLYPLQRGLCWTLRSTHKSLAFSQISTVFSNPLPVSHALHYWSGIESWQWLLQEESWTTPTSAVEGNGVFGCEICMPLVLALENVFARLAPNAQ